MEAIIYKESNSGKLYFVNSIDNVYFAIYTCKENGIDKQHVNNGVGIEYIYESFTEAQIDLDSYAALSDMVPLSIEERDLLLSTLAPPDDDPESDDGEPDQDNEITDSENDGAASENEACDWENASREEEKPPEAEDQEDGLSDVEVVKGHKVTVRGHEFSSFLSAIDRDLNSALRTALDARQGFKVDAKLIFTPTRNGFRPSMETGFQFDPIKVKNKEDFNESLEIVLDEYGEPIIPDNREHQLTIEEISEAGATVTADESGMVESVELDDELSEEKTHPESSGTCEKVDCPYYTLYDDWVGACIISSEATLAYEESCQDVRQAIDVYDCTRPKIRAAYDQFAREEIAMDEDVELREIQAVEELAEYDESSPELYNFYDNGGEPA